MFNDEDRRYMYETLQTSMGRRMAELVMGHLPPAGWADLATHADIAATRTDLAALGSELRGEMALLRGEMAELRGETKALLPRLVAANIASMIGVAGLVLAAGALL